MFDPDDYEVYQRERELQQIQNADPMWLYVCHMMGVNPTDGYLPVNEGKKEYTVWEVWGKTHYFYFQDNGDPAPLPMRKPGS